MVFEAALIVFWAVGVNFGDMVFAGRNAAKQRENTEFIKNYYPQLQDIHVMVFVGFGFLMTFLKLGKWTAVSLNWLVGCFAFQFGVVALWFWHQVFTADDDEGWKILRMDITWIIRGDFIAATCLVTMGAVVGKLNMAQYLFLAAVEVAVATLSQAICDKLLGVLDIGSTYYVHTFGAYFGLACVWAMRKYHRNVHDHENNSASYISNSFSMLGTIFLFMYWPSFNSALGSGAGSIRAIINTVLSLSSSVIAVFLVSIFFHDGYLKMETVLNACIAGGVVIGSSADLFESPYICMICGAAGGLLASFGVAFVEEFIADKFGIYDTCGVNNLHGMPGILGCFLSAIAVGVTEQNEIRRLVGTYHDLGLENRDPSYQAGIQIAGLFVTLGFALGFGLITGFILRTHIFNPIPTYFDDSVFWQGLSEDRYPLHNLKKTAQVPKEMEKTETEQHLKDEEKGLKTEQMKENPEQNA